jgi:hypothetical protein
MRCPMRTLARSKKSSWSKTPSEKASK